MRRLLLGLIGLAVLVGVGVAVWYLRISAPVAVSTTPPTAATIDVGEVANESRRTPPAPPTPSASPSPIGPAPEPSTTIRPAAPEPTGDPTEEAAARTTPPALEPRAGATEPRQRPTARPRLAPSVYRIDPERSRATYRVRETFLENVRVVTAEGSTRAVAGEILVDPERPVRSRVGEIVIDVSQLASDSERRDNAIRRAWLESARYPRATFRDARLSGLPARVSRGRPFSFRMTGAMTVRTATRRQAWDVTATLEGDTLRGEATTRITMSDYGVEPPNIAGFVAVEDDLELTLAFVATAVRGGGDGNHYPCTASGCARRNSARRMKGHRIPSRSAAEGSFRNPHTAAW